MWFVRQINWHNFHWLQANAGIHCHLAIGVFSIVALWILFERLGGS